MGTSLVDIRKTPYVGAMVETVEIFHRDHLGSVDAVTDANDNGTTTPIASLAFEPFGARRSVAAMGLQNISTSEMTNLLAKKELLNSQGFTGHESLDRTGLIHMNGRVYDPKLARFLSPDPIVNNPTNSQSWNRYSYVSNNPLKYTDPTGFDEHCTTTTQNWETEQAHHTVITDSCTNTDILDSPSRSDNLGHGAPKDAPTVPSTSLNTVQNGSGGGAGSCVGNGDITCAMGDASDVPCLPGDSRCDSYAGTGYDSDGLSDFLGAAWDAFNSLPPQAGPLEVKLGVLGIGYAAKNIGQLSREGGAAITYTRSALQHTFKHAKDFGVIGNANNKTLSLLSNAIHSHVNSLATKTIEGTYRGSSVTHFVNPSTGLNVMTNSSGNLLSGWLLNPAQLENVMLRGSL